MHVHGLGAILCWSIGCASEDLASECTDDGHIRSATFSTCVPACKLDGRGMEDPIPLAQQRNKEYRSMAGADVASGSDNVPVASC